jgi:hypothetical protein
LISFPGVDAIVANLIALRSSAKGFATSINFHIPLKKRNPEGDGAERKMA